MQTLAERFELYLQEKADEVTAEEWMPWVREQTPRIDDLPGLDPVLETLLAPLRESGYTVDKMQWAAHEKRRAEEEGLTSQREWLRDYMERRFSESVVEETFDDVGDALPPMESEMGVSDYLTMGKAFEEKMDELGFEHLDEIGRLDEGLPGRN